MSYLQQYTKIIKIATFANLFQLNLIKIGVCVYIYIYEAKKTFAFNFLNVNLGFTVANISLPSSAPRC